MLNFPKSASSSNLEILIGVAMSPQNHMFFNNKGKKLLQPVLRTIYLLISLCLILAIPGCKTTGGPSGNRGSAWKAMQYQKVENGGWLSVFLNLKESGGPGIELEVASVAAKAGNEWVSLRNEPFRINAAAIKDGQVFLARNGVPADNYDSIKIVLQKATLNQDGVGLDLAIEQKTLLMDLPTKLSLRTGESHSLFVTWDVNASLAGPESFSATMTAALQSIPFISDLVYVSCPEFDTIYIITNDKNWVISSLGIPGRPTYIYADPMSSRLYVLAMEQSAIIVVDLIRNRIIDKYMIALDNKPTFMVPSSDKRNAYVFDEKGRTIVSIDLLAGTVKKRATLFFEPHYASFIEQSGKLVVTAADSDTVYFLDPERLVSIGSLAVGSKPDGLLAWQNFLFVAESGANTVTAYDLLSLQQRGRVNVGFSPRRFLLKNNQLYISNFLSGSITVMIPGQFNVSNDFFIEGKPLELAATNRRFWIYAGDAQNGGLAVVDATSNRLTQFIDLHASTLGIAVLD